MTMVAPSLHLPAGSAGDGTDPVVVTPESAGWSYAALRVLALDAGERRDVQTGEFELAVLPLTAAEVTVEIDGQRYDLNGRTSVFDRVSDFAYLPRDDEARITAVSGGDIALPAARARRRLDPYHGLAEEVSVEVRGAGPATRQVTNFLAPAAGGFPTDTLCSVEVLTPPGNWSSYPPHKHDEASEHEAILEEIYFFGIEGEPGFGLHRTYTTDGEIDATVTVRHGDVFLIPRGYHGPCVAAPGYPMWYLNVLGGPGPDRTMAFCDDPAHHWVRETWTGMAIDPRCPMTSAAGRLGS